MDAIDDIIAGVEPDELVEEYGFPISRLLARLLRPTFIAPEGKLLTWGDWDQIEARVLPWLADSPAADQKLDLFRTGQDVYRYAAAPIFGIKPDDIDDQQRQIGKVSELALGFGGANGAFAAMGRGYGIALPTSQVTQIVQAWRKQNDWCVQFWYKLWDAAMAAFNHPGEWYSAGRVKYLYHPNLMRGTLICMLPDGRWLVYPQFKHERAIVKVKKNGVETEEIKWRTTFVKGFAGGAGRVELWYGVLCIAEDTEVLTDRGWLPIQDITNEKVWDGFAWVAHKGLARNGERATIQVYGVSMTPDHLVKTTEGWREGCEAQRDRLDRETVRLPDRFETRETETQSLALGLPMRMREASHCGGQRLAAWKRAILRLQAPRTAQRSVSNAWHEQTPGVRGVAQFESTLHEPETPRLAQLRRAGYSRLRALAGIVRKFLGRYGSDVPNWFNAGPAGQLATLHTRQLPVGVFPGASQQPSREPLYRNAVGANDSIASVQTRRCESINHSRASETRLAGNTRVQRVYDLIDCGTRRQFVVRGIDGPVLVHNCENITQATAASFLRDALVECENTGIDVVIHTHDEVVVETGENRVDETADQLKEIMEYIPDWADGLPLSVSVESGPFYTK